MNVKHVIWASIMSTTISCQSVKKEYTSFEEYPIPEGKLVEMEYSPIETKFTLWAPTAEEKITILTQILNIPIAIPIELIDMAFTKLFIIIL